ncbi:MAG: hybrid sensor histidine kinase/response regulator [Bacteroidales bacterium]|nr:hybrid sensor histidine kinase/response regulator [Bacteroidales bacterium]
MKKNSLILLVDDIPQNIQLLGAILKNQGYSFALTTSGKETYKLLEKTTPDIILLDVMLPDEDGFSICRKLKSKEKTADIPILFLTAKNDTADKVQGFKVGAVDYITKPFEELEVIERVKNHLQAKLDRDQLNEYNKELEVVVEQRTNELLKKERDTILAQFIQGVVHNIRGPISSALAASDLIQAMRDDLNRRIEEGIEKEELKEKMEEVWQILELNNEVLRKMAGNLEAMLRKSRTDQMQEDDVYDLNEMIKHELEFLDVDLKFKNQVEKSIRLSSEKLAVFVSLSDIAQVFENLIKNAMDAMFAIKNPSITIESGSANGYHWFSVEDSGEGIPAQIIDKIFDPFFTTKPLKADSKGLNAPPVGTGIGLQFCKKTIEHYKGKIEVEKGRTKGAKFTVYLPVFN